MFPFLASIIPTIGVSFLFWLAIRAMLQADRRERMAMARADQAAGDSRTTGTTVSDASEDGI